ncbi:MAG: SEC-C domain-containing protein [Clostridia bacterium]|nr:SEC-C domain-containing protein [Clostridia bacterium]
MNNIINTNNTINTRGLTSCGSGKKYKNCCGRNQ